MQRFRERPERWGTNSWKAVGREPFKLDRVYNPFRETFPMQIRNWVLGKGTNVKQSPCVPEMMKLFECLQRNEYHQNNCEEPLGLFQGCYASYKATNLKKRTATDLAEPVPGSRQLPTAQLNTLLGRYPHKLKKL